MDRSLATPVRSHTTAPARRGRPARPSRKPLPPIPLQRPELPEPAAILEYYELSRQANFYSNGGPCATLLSERLSEYLGGETHCIPVSNCTVGLMVALRAACGRRRGPRRRVLCPSYTFTATGCAVAWCDFDPVFVDVEPDGWHINPDQLEIELSRYAGSVKGVLACATFGTAPSGEQRAAWRAICASHDVPLVIDSAPGFGALDEFGRRLGGLGDVEVFSFHATKPFAIGEGGMIATPDPELAKRIRRLLNFGLERGSRASAEIGLNGKMSELHAATGLAMLDMFDDVLRRRRANARRLSDTIAHLPYTHQRGAVDSTWQIFHLQAPSPAVRARCVELAPAYGVELRTMHDPSLHRQPAFARHATGCLDVTDRLGARALALPMANDLPDHAFERIPALLATAAAAG
jgi:dTDP-4-amino-4,6-dideoxygalactose transaminase